MPGTSENAVLAALEAVVRDHGWDVAAHPQRLRAVLSDVLGSHADEHRGALDAIVVSADEGIPFDIRAAGRSGIAEATPGLVQRLADWGLTPERASFVVSAWAALLPETTVQPAPPATTEPPVVAATEPPPPAVTEQPPAATDLPAAQPVSKQPASKQPATAKPASGQAGPVEPTALPVEPTPAATELPSPTAEPPTGRPTLRTPRHNLSRNALVATAAVVALVVGGVAAAVTLTDGDEGDPPVSGPTARTSDQPPGSTDAPAATGAELVADTGAKPPKAAGVFAMAARRTGVRITHVGEVGAIGTGEEMRSRPAGGRLIAFRLGSWDCDQDACDPWEKARLSVRVGSEVRELPAGGPTYVVAVPAGTTDVDLTLKASGVTQTLSLPDGEPGSDNLQVLARSPRVVKLGERRSAAMNMSQPVAYQDGDRIPRRTYVLDVFVDEARLSFFARGLDAKEPDRALLTVNASYSLSDYGIAARKAFLPHEISLEVGGRPIRATRFDAGNPVFRVPADLHRATLVIGGRSFDAGSYTETLQRVPVQLRLP